MAYFVFGFTLVSLYELFNDETFSLATDTMLQCVIHNILFYFGLRIFFYFLIKKCPFSGGLRILQLYYTSLSDISMIFHILRSYIT